MAKKACSRLLCCFTGRSVVHNSDELDSSTEVCHSNSKSRRCSPWSELRAKKKKKTVPVDGAVEEIFEVNRGDAPEEGDVGKNKLVSAKKGYFHKFHKKSSSKQSHSTKLDHKQQQPIIRHVFSKCAARSQPALLCHVRTVPPEPVKIGTGPSCPTETKAKKREKRRFGESDRQMIVLLMLATTLGAMLLGGRAVAIVSMSALAYLSPYVKDMSRTKDARRVDP